MFLTEFSMLPALWYTIKKKDEGPQKLEQFQQDKLLAGGGTQNTHTLKQQKTHTHWYYPQKIILSAYHGKGTGD